MRKNADFLLGLVLVSSLAACQSTLVEKRRRVYGPVKEVGLIDAGGGMVRYPLKGPGWLVRARRRSAFKKMGKYCEGADLVRVEKEETREESLIPYNASDLDAEKILQGHYQVEEFRYVKFKCVKP